MRLLHAQAQDLHIRRSFPPAAILILAPGDILFRLKSCSSGLASRCLVLVFAPGDTLLGTSPSSEASQMLILARDDPVLLTRLNRAQPRSHSTCNLEPTTCKDEGCLAQC